MELYPLTVKKRLRDDRCSNYLWHSKRDVPELEALFNEKAVLDNRVQEILDQAEKIIISLESTRDEIGV